MRYLFFFATVLNAMVLVAQKKDSVYVANEKELIAAVKSNRVIILNAIHIPLKNKLVIKDVLNLSITNNFFSKTRLTIPEDKYKTILSVINSTNISLNNLTLKLPNESWCGDNILKVEESKKVIVSNCILSGEKKMVSDCTYEDDTTIIMVKNSDIIFEKTKVYGINQYINLDLSSNNAYKSSISFYDCDFYLNAELKIKYREPYYKNCNFYGLDKRLLLKNYNGYYPKKPATITATILVNYPPWKSNENYDEGVLGGSCNNTCEVSATSTLNTSGSNSYAVKNILDLSENFYINAWVEGVKGAGIGERIKYKVITILGDGEPWRMNLGIKLVNGYAKNLKTWQNNNRIKSFKLYRNGTYVATIQLQDTPNAQEIKLGDINNKNSPTIGEIFEFEITAVYKGKKYDDTALTLLVFGCSP